MWLGLLVVSALAATAPAERIDLKGIVKNEAGAPIEGATVLILTAQPRAGVGLICPSCYLDCWRTATTDAKGRFIIDKVDASLVFRVGALTPAHETAFVSKVDPAVAEAEITLQARPPIPDAPRRVARGRLVDLDGKPIAHAVIAPEGYRVGARQYFGPVEGIASLTLTDEHGAFTLVAGKDVDGFFLKVSARGLATTRFDNVATGLEERKLAMGPGCAVRGRVVRGDQPVPDLTIACVQTDRSSDTFVGELTAVTNAEGRFVLANVTPNDLVVIHSAMRGSPHGALPLTYVETTDHGTVVDLGVIALGPVVKLTGRLVPSEGQRIPRGRPARAGQRRRSLRSAPQPGPETAAHQRLGDVVRTVRRGASRHRCPRSLLPRAAF